MWLCSKDTKLRLGREFGKNFDRFRIRLEYVKQEIYCMMINISYTSLIYIHISLKKNCAFFKICIVTRNWIKILRLYFTSWQFISVSEFWVGADEISSISNKANILHAKRNKMMSILFNSLS